jgi:hypothetical protein
LNGRIVEKCSERRLASERRLEIESGQKMTKQFKGLQGLE